MFAFLNSTFQVLQKRISLLNSICRLAISDINLFLLGIYGLLPITALTVSFVCVTCHMLYKQKMYVQVTCRNQILCSYDLDKRHGQFFWAH